MSGDTGKGARHATTETVATGCYSPFQPLLLAATGQPLPAPRLPAGLLSHRLGGQCGAGVPGLPERQCAANTPTPTRAFTGASCQCAPNTLTPTRACAQLAFPLARRTTLSALDTGSLVSRRLPRLLLGHGGGSPAGALGEPDPATVFAGGYLLAVVPAYGVSVLLFQGMARLLHEAALPKPVAHLITTLAAVLLVLLFAWVGAWSFFFVEGYPPSCSQRFVSPSGQRTLVLENRDDWLDSYPTGHVYVESGWWLRELPDPLGPNACTDTSLSLQWSADEKQINWQTLGSNGHGQWQW